MIVVAPRAYRLPSLLALAAPLLLALACGGEPQAEASSGDVTPEASVPDSGVVKAIWVTRFDYKTREDVELIVANCVDAGFNTIVFQVRGNATAFYASPFEPWAIELEGQEPGGAPGFDPLAVAVEEARAAGASLHAWVNLMPAWWGTEAPTDPMQVVNAHPEWLWWDQHGERQALCEDFYVSLNPCLPVVRRYLTDVVTDIAARYEVEGVHLDYARFPNEPPATPAGTDIDYPRDARTLDLYRRDTGLHPDDAPEGPVGAGGARHPWDAWRTEQVTALVASIRMELATLESPPLLTSAVTSVPERGLEHFQDSRGWVESGLVDAVFPMNYTQDAALFQERLEHWPADPDGPAVVMGVRASLTGDHAKTRALIQTAVDSHGGFCLFAYSNLFDSTNEAIDDQDEATRAARAERREALLPFLREL